MYFKTTHAALLEALLRRCQGLQQSDSRFLLKVGALMYLPLRCFSLSFLCYVQRAHAMHRCTKRLHTTPPGW